MVSFQCDGCSDVVKKPKLNQHGQRCRATFTCIDCSTTFMGYDYQSHTSCITEAEKYQKALYKGKKAVPQKAATPKSTPAAVTKPVSLVEQLKQKKAESEKPSEETKKRKSSDELKDAAKKQKSTEWSLTEISSDMAENMEFALKHVLKENSLSLNDARKKALELIENHPKSSLSKSEKKDLKKQFDKSLQITLENNTLTLKRKLSWNP
ncbi:hypothetical protein F4703DRAFT_1795894 [Phycomyces blakesleeanus]